MIKHLIFFTLCCGASVNFVYSAVMNENDNNAVARGLDAKGMLTSLATNFMSRGYATTAAGGSQVVSLNLTNLLVLVLLKALIFAAGSLGAGTWKGGLARSNDGEEKILSDEEILLYLSFLTGGPGENGCLQSIACQQPDQAKRYAAAGDMLLKASKIFNIDPDISYDYTLQELDQSANVGLSGGDCSKYKCNTKSNDQKKKK